MRHRFYPFEKKPFHLSHRTTYSREENRAKIWNESVELIRDLGNRRIITAHAYVLMSNHFHFLWAPNEVNEKLAFEEFGGKIARILDCDVPLWSDSVFAIDSFYQFRQVYKYIYRNPVDAGLVFRVEEYPFSTLQTVLGKQKNIAGLLDPFGLIFDQFRMLEWLNTPPSQNEMAARSVNSC